MNSTSQSPSKQRQTIIQRKQPIIFWIFILLAIPATIFVLVYSAGYRYDRDSGLVTRTSAISVYTIPRGATVLLNGMEQKTRTPFIQTIPAGSLRVTVEKEGYQRWEKSVTLDPGRSAVFADTVLFYAEPQIVENATNGNSDAAKIESHGVRGNVDETMAKRIQDIGFSDPSAMIVYDSGPSIVLSDEKTQKTFVISSWQNASLEQPLEGVVHAVSWVDRNTFAYATGSEVRLYTVSSKSQDLLARQASAITTVGVHEAGSVIYFTDATGVYAVERDSRDHRQIWTLLEIPRAHIVELRENGRVMQIEEIDTKKQSSATLYEQSLILPLPVTMR